MWWSYIPKAFRLLIALVSALLWINLFFVINNTLTFEKFSLELLEASFPLPQRKRHFCMLWGRTSLRYGRGEVLLNDCTVPGVKLSSRIQNTHLYHTPIPTFMSPRGMYKNTQMIYTIPKLQNKNIHIFVILKSMSDRTTPRKITTWGEDVQQHCNRLLISVGR